MMELRLDVSEFEKRAKQLDAAEDQIPFALSLALNSAVQDARGVLIQDTWPKHVTERNASFIRWALGMVFSTKHNLRVEINDKRANTRGHLALHMGGGVKVANLRLAIPPRGSVQRGAHGVRKDQLPAAIVAHTPKRALRVTAGGIFVGVAGRLQLKYFFRQSVRQPADVPFADAFRDAVVKATRASFAGAMARAMRTRR
jgi:hypothetical protein